MSRYLTRRESNLFFILLMIILVLGFFSVCSLLRFKSCSSVLGNDSPICYKYAIKGDL